ncbi:hypothetical protein [Clostridium polynesiense]|uniref:hypothetical protein n=1 Tax=Clostridium polynesiense TaxID=1325933 RepID=UPI000A932F59|nr:hypothetical protein [Clostridium polynesiense]
MDKKHLRLLNHIIFISVVILAISSAIMEGNNLFIRISILLITILAVINIVFKNK